MLWKIARAGNDPVVGFAAGELARYLKCLDPRLETPVFLFPRETDLPALWLTTDNCPDDGWRISVKDGVGLIHGSNPRSVLMAVYRLLKELGCAWVRPGPDGEIIPKKDLARVEIHLAQKASYRHRGVCIEGAVSYENIRDMIDWLPKLGLNAYFIQFHNPVTFFNHWYEHTGNPTLEGSALSAPEIEALRDQLVWEIKKRGLLYHADGHGWTCEPFGLPGETWDAVPVQVPPATRKYLAKVHGRRQLHEGVPLDTNLCYSNPAVRRRIVKAVAARCREHPEIDYVQVWLADGVNNHCECAACQSMRPSDWYMVLLNEIDAEMTRLKLPQKVVFLLYVDLLWEPEKITLRNPDRFTLMFAPFTRTFSSSIADAAVFPEEQLPDYHRNHLSYPKSVEENLAWLRRWQARFPGDSFDYDYHFGRDHYSDPSYCDISRTVFRDMQALHSVGLQGMISCQTQRVFLPTGLGMTAMAAALWDEHADYDAVADAYYRDAFGPEGGKARAYLEGLAKILNPVYLRAELPAVNPEEAAKLRQVPAHLDRFAPAIAAQAENPALAPGIRKSWWYLQQHALLCRSLALAFQRKAEGRFPEARQALEDCFALGQKLEASLQPVFDVFKFQMALRPRLERGMD